MGRAVAVRLLVEGQLRTRWRRYLLVALNAGFGFFGFLVVVMVTQGAEEAIVEPIGAVFSGDARVTLGTSHIPAEAAPSDMRAIAATLDRRPGVEVTSRIESGFVTVRGERLDHWTAGLLLGVEPGAPREVDAIAPYLDWGTAIRSIDVIDPATGRAYAPLVLGDSTARRLALTLPEDGTPAFNETLTLTSGRLEPSGLPLTVECVVVGVFGTGLDPLDKFTGFVPIQTARRLAGFGEGDPVANALILHGGDAEAAAQAARGMDGVSAETTQDLAFQYLGSILLIVYAAGGIGLALFFTVLLVWLLHETAVLVRVDGPVISSLRAIGVPARDITASYVLLMTCGVAAGVLLALVVAGVLAATAPPLTLETKGVSAEISWGVEPAALALVLGGALGAALLAAWSAARRVQRLDIRAGLQGQA